MGTQRSIGQSCSHSLVCLLSSHLISFRLCSLEEWSEAHPSQSRATMSSTPAPLSINHSVANARNANAANTTPHAKSTHNATTHKNATAAQPLSQRSSRSTTRAPPIAPGSGRTTTSTHVHVTTHSSSSSSVSSHVVSLTHVSSRRSSVRRSDASPAPAPLPSPDAVASSLRESEPVSLVRTGREGVHLALRVGGGGSGRDPAAASAVTRLMLELTDKFPRVYSSSDEAAMLSHSVAPLVGAMFAADGRSSSVVCKGSVAGESSTLWGDSFRTRLASLQQVEMDAAVDKENGERFPATTEARRGALAVALEQIFAYMCDPDQLANYSFALGVSMVDISLTEQLSDCFAPNATTQPKLLESWTGSLTVANVTRKLLHSQSHAMRVIAAAASTPAAPGSHRVLTLSVEKRLRDGAGAIVCSQMQFFDLASPMVVESESDPIGVAAGSTPSSTRRTVVANPSLAALDKVVMKLAQLSRSSNTLPLASPATAPHSAGGSQQHVAYRESKLTRLLKSCLGASECRNHCLFLLTLDAREAAEPSHAAQVKFARKICRISNTMVDTEPAAADAGPLPGHAYMHDELEKGDEAEVPAASPRPSPRPSPSSAHLHLHRSQSSPSLAVVGVSIRARRRLFDGDAPAQSPAPSRTPSKSPDGSRRVQLSASRRKAAVKDQTAPVAATPAAIVNVDAIAVDDASALVDPNASTASVTMTPVASGVPQPTRRWRVSCAKPAPPQQLQQQQQDPFAETHELPGELARALHLPNLRTPESSMVSIGQMPGSGTTDLGATARRPLDFSHIPLTALSSPSPAPWPRAPNSTRRWMVRPSVTPSIAEVNTSNESSSTDGAAATAADLAAMQAARDDLEKRLASALSAVQELTSKQQHTERLMEQLQQSADSNANSNAAESAAAAAAATAAAVVLAAQAECDLLRAELTKLQEQLSSATIPMNSLVEAETDSMDGDSVAADGADGEVESEDDEECFDSFLGSSTLHMAHTPVCARLADVDESPVLNQSEALDESTPAESPTGARSNVVYRRALRLLDRAGIDLRRVSMNDTSSSLDDSTASNVPAAPVVFLSPQPASPPPPMSPAPQCSPIRTFTLPVSPAACSRVKQLIRTGIQMQSFALHSPAAHPRCADAGSLTPQQLRTLHVHRVRPPAALVLPSRQRAAQVAPILDQHFATITTEHQERSAADGQQTKVAEHEPAALGDDKSQPQKSATTAQVAEAALPSDPLEAESQRLRACAARFQAHRKQQQQDEKLWQSAAGCNIM